MIHKIELRDDEHQPPTSDVHVHVHVHAALWLLIALLIINTKVIISFCRTIAHCAVRIL